MKASELSFDCGSNDDDSVVPGQTDSSGYFQGPEVNAVSCIADTYTISGIANRTISGDMTLLLNLKNAIKSKGLKMLYYSSTTDGYRDFTDTWGETTSAYATEAGFTSGTTPVLFVRCLKLSVRNTADSKLLRYTLTMKESTS